MIQRYVAQSSTLGALREELYSWLSANSNIIKGLEWRNDNDHSEGFNAFYDEGKTDFCAYMCVNNNTPSEVAYNQNGGSQYFGNFHFIMFPFSEAFGIGTGYNTSTPDTTTIYKTFFVETETAFMLICYKTYNATITLRNGQYFILTKNRGCAINYSFGGSWSRRYAFKGDFTEIYMSQSTYDTNLTCFAPLCGRSQSVPNNQIYFTPFTSTPDYPCIIDSDIGKYATDGYFAIAEYLEEVQ